MPTTPEQKAEGWLSVTEVLDAFIPKGLLDWYLKTGRKEAKRLSTVAMKIGSRVDALIQEEVNTGTFKYNSKDSIEIHNCMEAWKQFKADYSPKILSTQLEVKSDSEKLVGHIDLIFNNRVVDVKCASSIKPNHWLQVAKYSDMMTTLQMNELDNLQEKQRGIAILRLDKNLGTYQFMTHEQAEVNWTECVNVFDGLLGAYRYYNPPKAVEEVVNE